MTIETDKKKLSFNGLRVGALESRMRVEMETLIRNFGGDPIVAPSMREVHTETTDHLLKFGNDLINHKIDVVILMTGVGTRMLMKTLSPVYGQEPLVNALSSTTTVVRGPKPQKALTELNLKPTVTVPEPNTWREILKTIDQSLDLKNKVVAVQEHGEPNKLFLAELKARGATVQSIVVYTAQLPEDTDPLKKLVLKLTTGEIEVLLFTNATQVEHMFMISRELGEYENLKKALRHVVIASVGPSATQALTKFSVAVDIEPDRPMMGALVAAAAEKSTAALTLKKKNTCTSEKTEFSIPTQTRIDLSANKDLYNSLFLKACRREPTDQTPIWLMRQAGRYMKEYREIRAKHDFLDLCKNSDLCAEVTVDAAHRLGVDAAIIFSDLLVLVEPLGFQLSYGKDQGPLISNPFRQSEDLGRLRMDDIEHSMRYVCEAIRKTRSALKPNIPLIGFAGAPFTMASYIIEGKGSKNFINTKKLMLSDEKTWNSLLTHITQATVIYLNAQIAAGAQAVQIFDSWVGCLTPELYRTYVFPHLKNLIRSLTPGIPVISFGTQTNGLLSLMKQAGGDVFGVDWRIELDEAWEILGPDVAIMGNLDPTLLLTGPKEIETAALRILKQAGGRPGHIFNLGHGILPETSIDNVLHLIDVVHRYKHV